MYLASGEEVFDRPRSNLTEEVRNILPEVLSKIQSQKNGSKEASPTLKNDGGFFTVEVDLGRNVGKTNCVKTSTDDKILYARRIVNGKALNRLSRFVKNRQTEDSSKVTVVLKETKPSEEYVIITAYIGVQAAPEPGDYNEKPESSEFWKNHALIYGAFEVVDIMDKKPKITISGSFNKEKNFKGMLAAIKEFEDLGIEVLSPRASEISNPGADFLILETDDSSDPKTLEQRHLDAISEGDLLYLYNLNGYMGSSTILEIGYAVARNVPVVSKEPVTDFTLQLFIAANGISVKDVLSVINKTNYERKKNEH